MNPTDTARLELAGLPDNARIIAGPDVWLETNAVDQLARVAGLPACRRAVGLPDLHAGRGIPIGAAFAFEGEIRPRLVGGDAGCGVRVVAVRKLKAKGDALLRRLDGAMQGPALPECDPRALLDAVWRAGPRGLAAVDGAPRSLAEWAAGEPEFEAPEGPPPDDPTFARQIGTVGGGNHFVELSRVDQVVDKAAGRALGLSAGGWAVVAHSGSRGLGGALAREWGGEALTDPARQAAYLDRLRGALNYARANRMVLAWRILSVVGAAKASRITGDFDLVHNTVCHAPDGSGAWLHRKGAAPAAADQPTVVLGSRGAPSWVMLGAGSSDSLWSVAHGAGRKMARGEAVAKLRTRYDRRSLSRTSSGGHVFCDDAQLLYAEHPDAYKPVEPVVESLEAAGCARRVAALVPFANFKQ